MNEIIIESQLCLQVLLRQTFLVLKWNKNVENMGFKLRLHLHMCSRSLWNFDPESK